MRHTKPLLLTLSLLLTIAAASAQLKITTGGNTAGGLVTAVNGNIITVGGVLPIDASNAKLVGDFGGEARLADITPGTYVHAILRKSPQPAGAALAAETIAIVRIPQISLHSVVESVDVANNSFTVLGRTIKVDANTSFRSLVGSGNTGLADLQTGSVVDVDARNVNGAIVASVVQVFARTTGGGTIAATGIIESINGNEWKIGNRVVVVNAQTKIAGDPKVGDYVSFVAFVDSSNQLLALSIIKMTPPPPVGDSRFIHATVTSISATSWVIRPIGLKDITLTINSATQIDPGIKVGDLVDVTASFDNRTYVALTIRKAAPPVELPTVMRVVGTVAAIGTSEWQITEPNGQAHPYAVNSATIIQPGIKVGDVVEIYAVTKPGEKPVAISIRLTSKTRATSR
jgi:hypothetical protein